MREQIEEIRSSAMALADGITDAKLLEAFRNRFLGRKGEIALLFGELPKLALEEKKEAGALLNSLRMELEAVHKSKEEELLKSGIREIRHDSDNILLPGKKIKRGSVNILTQVMDELLGIFTSMGYCIATGPEIETSYNNFEALNIPDDHPSKDMWSTFYLKNGKLLRTHTSPVQVRFMKDKNNIPPFAAVFPGKVYRRDAADASHLPVFHQLEGLAVGENITMSDLKGTLTHFLRKMFGKEKKVRFRPSFFPFTEPSAEVDVECIICKGDGCQMCKSSGWLEILGSGMVDPNVFRAVGYDPEKVSGFAFGMGIERIAILKYGIEDIRLFFENRIEFLRQFQ